jgi:AcrR family transcriptional regulator
MAGRGRTTRARIVEAAYGAFYREGYGRVSMDGIAAAASVTKRTVYQHFESKDALLCAVLEAQEEAALALIRDWAPAGATSPAAFVDALFDGLEAWAARPRWLGSGYTRLALELADLPGHPARRTAARHKRAVEAWLGLALGDLGAAAPERLARGLALLIEGAAVLALVHGDRAYVAAARGAAHALLAEPPRRP